MYLCGMTDERLSRHLQQENADLKSENSRLRMQTDTQETKLQEKDSEVLRLLNQIATDMIRKSDVDRLVEEAVAKATAALKADYEERMKAMAAEYEAKIAELQNQKDGKGDDKDETPGKSTKNSKKKGGTVICNTMEEAMQRIQEEMNKAAVMQDQAFGGGSEKLSSEQKSAVNPEEENADDDSKVQSPVSPRGDYGERNNESKPRPEEYSNYIKVDKEDEIILGVVIVPTVFTIIWLSVFSAIALSTVQGWSIESVQELIASPETAVFIVFSHYPLSKVISVMICVLLGVFFITSADSATYSLSVMTTNGDINPPVYKKVVWGIVVATIAYILLSAGSLKPLQTISIAATLPFLIVMIAMMPALVKDLRESNLIKE